MLSHLLWWPMLCLWSVFLPRPLIFWDGPHSTSYLSLHLRILLERSKNLRFTGNILVSQPGEFGKPQPLASLALERDYLISHHYSPILSYSLPYSLSFAFLLSVTFLDLASHIPWAWEAQPYCQSSSQASRDLNHRIFAFWVCLIHHLINC